MTGCRYEAVFHWLSRLARDVLVSDGDAPATAPSDAAPEHRRRRLCARVVADVACGIGLPGHTLRLCGYRGRLVGLDLSSRMLEKAQRRASYDELQVGRACVLG